MEVLSDTELYQAHTEFAATSFGEQLAQNIRFSRYNLAELSHAAWSNLLGADTSTT